MGVSKSSIVADAGAAAPGQPVTVEIPLPTAGVYPFYCTIDFHSGLGMKGRIEVQ